MKHRKYKFKLIGYIVPIVIFVICILLSKTLFEWIYYSDMPIWLKYILLS